MENNVADLHWIRLRGKGNPDFLATRWLEPPQYQNGTFHLCHLRIKAYMWR